MARQSKMGRYGLGPGGCCKCPRCGYRVEHQAGKPCREFTCPNCAVALVREESPEHR
jgi:hypothetical protein